MKRCKICNPPYKPKPLMPILECEYIKTNDKFLLVERDIPRLGTKHFQVGNETFPSWEKMKRFWWRGLQYQLAFLLKLLQKNLSSLPQSLKTRINTGGLSDERFFASLPHLSCISPYSMRDVGRDQGGKRERLRKSPPSRNACVQRLFGRLRERWLFLQKSYFTTIFSVTSSLPILALMI